MLVGFGAVLLVWFAPTLTLPRLWVACYYTDDKATGEGTKQFDLLFGLLPLPRRYFVCEVRGW